jgi:hypothetical protein
VVASETETPALHLLRALYDSTDGLPQEWRMLEELDGASPERLRDLFKREQAPPVARPQCFHVPQLGVSSENPAEGRSNPGWTKMAVACDASRPGLLRRQANIEAIGSVALAGIERKCFLNRPCRDQLLRSLARSGRSPPPAGFANEHRRHVAVTAAISALEG